MTEAMTPGDMTPGDITFEQGFTGTLHGFQHVHDERREVLGRCDNYI